MSGNIDSMALSPPDLHGKRSCETTLASFPGRSRFQFCILQKLEVGTAWEQGFLSDKPIPIYRIQRFSFPNCEPGGLIPQDLADLWTAISPVYTISSLEGKPLHEGMNSFFPAPCRIRMVNTVAVMHHGERNCQKTVEGN